MMKDGSIPPWRALLSWLEALRPLERQMSVTEIFYFCLFCRFFKACTGKYLKVRVFLKAMEKERKSSKQLASLEKPHVDGEADKSIEDVISMADSSVTIEDIEGELCKIERLRDILVRRESELRYMMDDIQLCKEITRLKTELQKLVSIPDKDKSKEDRDREEELLQQINKLVETRDFLVDDVEFERLREREEDRDMAAFLQSKFPKTLAAKGALRDQKVACKSQQTSAPFITKTGLTLLKDCCGFTCSIM
uniref:bMERB domain-containing protein 1 isoform X2 n=2 Tax=Scatophagus argus TaxID=75038 RepID=UPI001ED83546|nr:bMERB domain-containing protein 1 isoform X2 [Scatophagus argus]